MVRKDPDKQAREQIAYLRSRTNAREGKYIRNLNRYNNNGVRREDLWTPYVWPQAYVAPAQNTDGVQTQFNVIKNCVDALVSRISQANVRPFFNAINGDYETEKSCKALQQHFDYWLSEQHAYAKSIMCFRDALIFDMGVMEIDPETKSIDRIPPWEYFLDPAEYMHHAVSRVLRWRKYYPLVAVARKIDNPELKRILEEDPWAQDEYAVYYDLYNGKRLEYWGSHRLRDAESLDYEQSDGLFRRPFVEVFYTKPVKGFMSVSLADDLYPIQRQIDEIVRRFDNATRNMPLAIGFVPKGSGLKATQIGNAITLYDVLTGAENGQVSFHTPSPMSQEWIQLLKLYMDKPYEMVGLSQMSAQSKKPADIESGKALQTLEDVESDRFNVQLQQFTHFLVDVSRVSIKVNPKGETILPKKVLRSDVTWGDARDEMSKYSIQFSAASVLSKDPDKKMSQIMGMINGGFIDKAIAAHFLEIPDLEGVYTVESANYDAVQKIVADTLEGEEVEYWETVDLSLLQAETVKKINMLMAVGDDEKYILRLVRLLGKVSAQMKVIEEFVRPNEEPPAPPAEPMKNQSMDGGQVQNLSLIAEKTKQGLLTPSQAGAIISAAYPVVSPGSVQAIVSIQQPGALPPMGAPAAPPARPAPTNPVAGGANA